MECGTVSRVIEVLNQRYDCNICGGYYDRVRDWKSWWEGFYKPFHRYRQRLLSGKLTERKLYTLGMAKKVCEDWASILLNEKTEIAVDDSASSAYLLGENGLGGVLGENGFWRQGNMLVERAFMSGEGAFVLRVRNARASKDGSVLRSVDTNIRIEYIDATGIVPLSSSVGKITEAAFISRVSNRGKSYVYIETHTLEKRRYVIKNDYFLDDGGVFTKQPLPEGVPDTFDTGSDLPWFALIHPNITNNIPGNNGLGMSVYANAIDNLMGVDLAFNNMCRDFKLGGKKVFYNKEMLVTGESGQTLTPDDVAQQLFMQIGDSVNLEEKPLVHEFNPSLRVQENRDGIQAQLDYLSFKCGLGARHYQFNGERVMTATEYVGGRQDLVQNANKHYIVIEDALQTLVRAMLYIGREICGQGVNPDASVTVNFEDSYIIDKESERERDLQDVREGVLNKWEYRMKWYGETEDEAKAMLPDEPEFEPFGFGAR